MWYSCRCCHTHWKGASRELPDTSAETCALHPRPAPKEGFHLRGRELHVAVPSHVQRERGKNVTIALSRASRRVLRNGHRTGNMYKVQLVAPVRPATLPSHTAPRVQGKLHRREAARPSFIANHLPTRPPPPPRPPHRHPQHTCAAAPCASPPPCVHWS
jgi:hypothetical protein